MSLSSLSLLLLMLSTLLSTSESSTNNQVCDAWNGHGETQCGIQASSSSKILIKGGTVVNAYHQEITDVYVENGIIVAVKPNIKLEGEATSRAIRLASFVNVPLYVVHVMSIDAMEEIAKARKSAVNLVNLLHSLNLVGTDHCTFTSTQKSLGIDDFRKIPNGVNGIEERMHLVWHTMVESGKISPADYVRLTSTECARIFNIYPRKGAILAGSDADIIILNPNSSFEITTSSHHSRVDTNVYEGMKGKGKVEVTIAGGRIVWENDQLQVVPGTGKYIEMPPFSYLFDGIDKADAKYLSSLHAPVKRFNSTT
ncbi:hypothetical protein Ddye_022691 [Dipteronia dyeriana]|uniref:dihydropyrimidinase n=1 Tax=Dipteronia dyeriana TaxID=168575 RepID=A0AAD9TSH3_9ROSI|nr:hypothetical protein Ddye_022691 [Dipteronia dyeriana]